MSPERYEQVFPVHLPARLTLANIRGSIRILPGEAEQISVQAEKLSGSGSLDSTEIRMEQAEDGSVNIETRFDQPFFPFFFGIGPCKVEYTVQVPRQTYLKLNGVSCSVEVEGVEGELKVSTVSGPIEVRDLSGPVQLHTVSGSIRGENLSGSLSFDTVSGRVLVERSEFAKIDGSTVSGSVAVQTPLGEGPYRFHSVSGNVRLAVGPVQACKMSLSSVSGHIRTSFPVRARSKDNLELGSGGPTIYLSSISGSLYVEAEATAPAEEPVQPATQQEEATSTKAILERIERGEISVDEGLTLLHASG